MKTLAERLVDSFTINKPSAGVVLYRPYTFDIRYHKDFPWDKPTRKQKKGGADAFKVRKAKQS